VSEPSSESSDPGIQSPFSGKQSSLRTKSSPGAGKSIFVVLTVGVILTVLAVFVIRSVNDPLRTLRPFPVQNYYDHYASLEGTRFKATIRAAGQIGWKKELGRLVNFKVEPDGQPIVVLIPPKFDSQTFESGEIFDVELLVEEGGLIKVNHLDPR
jgi:hypothetical protein